jgi:hypothetical protein
MEEEMAPPRFDPFDPARLGLLPGPTCEPGARLRPPRHRRGEAFLKGPIPYAWVALACQLPGSGLSVALAVRLLCDRYRRDDGWSVAAIARGIGVSERAARRGLHAAEEAGLVVAVREPGCKPALAVVGLPTRDADSGRRPLYGPIPASWLVPALCLSTAAVRVAMACWLLAGWERAAEFELALSGWADLGLTRYAAGRGLGPLGAARLVVVTHRPGRSPAVRIADPARDPAKGAPATVALPARDPSAPECPTSARSTPPVVSGSGPAT